MEDLLFGSFDFDDETEKSEKQEVTSGNTVTQSVTEDNAVAPTGDIETGIDDDIDLECVPVPAETGWLTAEETGEAASEMEPEKTTEAETISVELKPEELQEDVIGSGEVESDQQKEIDSAPAKIETGEGQTLESIMPESNHVSLEKEQEVNQTVTPVQLEVKKEEASVPTESASETGTETPAAKKTPAKKETAAEKKKREHEEAEAVRKAEWDQKQAEKKKAEKELLEKVNGMADDDVKTESVKKLGDDAERLTRRNMKICVTEHVQEKCKADPEFARKAMHPLKSMLNCFRYINRKAQDFIKKEMEESGEKVSGMIGGDVPDDICYQWAEEYFLDANAPEDKEKEEKFVPKPYTGPSTSKTKKSEPKQAAKPSGEAKEAEESKDLIPLPESGRKTGKKEIAGQLSLEGNVA